LEVVRFEYSPTFQSRLRQKFRFGMPHKEIDMLHAAARRVMNLEDVTGDERDAS
jgi:hypothetical protein